MKEADEMKLQIVCMCEYFGAANPNFGYRKLIENKRVQVGKVHLAAARHSCEEQSWEGNIHFRWLRFS